MSTMEVAQRIREARVDRGWTQNTLAAKAGYNEKTIRRIEQGGAASMTSLRHVAKALDIDLSETSSVATEGRTRRQNRTRLTSGVECLSFLMENAYAERADAVVVDQSDDESHHDAILSILDVVELLRKKGDALAPKARYLSARKLHTALGVLTSGGWIVEGERVETEAYGEEWDFEYHSKLWIRRPTATAKGAK